MDGLHQAEIDPDFEPQQRTRCNTWPCRPKEVAVEAQSSPVSDESTTENQVKPDTLGISKKTSSRRNAWGNLSYADLITNAIQSSPEQRLTLSQIYDWMVQNVPYFKDKGDSTSSAGWKNSIRHNLSLHSRFMRIQNEGTGKSSWWVINPDAKPGKTPRRRAGSMETKSYEKRRGRVKKKVEALRAALENSNSPSSTTEDYFVDSPLGFQLSPDFRTRAGSNASSCGRLSPIQSGMEPDLHDNQVPPMSPIPWGQELDTSGNYDSIGQYDQLVDTLVDGMKIGEGSNLGISDTSGMGGFNDVEMTTDGLLVRQMLQSENEKRQVISNSIHGSLNNLNMSQYTDPSANYDDAQFGNSLPAPPAYPGNSIRQSSSHQGLESLLKNGGYGDVGQGQQGGMRMYNNQSPMYGQDSLLIQQTHSPSSSQLSINTQNMNTQQQQQQQLASPARSPHQVSPNYGGNRANYNAQPQLSPQINVKQLSPQQQQQLLSRQQQQQQQQQQQGQAGNHSILQRCLEAPSDSLLRAALTQKVPQYPNNVTTSMTQQQQQQQYNDINFLVSQPQQLTSLRPVPRQQLNATNGINNNIMTAQQGNRNMMPSVQMATQGQQSAGHLMSTGQMNVPVMSTGTNSNNSLSELEADFIGLDCDMEKVLQHELSLEGTLDFNFDPTTSTSGNVESSNMVR